MYLLKSDIGVDDNNKATASKVQAGAHEESARLPIGQQQGITAWSTDQNRQFDRGRSGMNYYFSREIFTMCTVLLVFPLCFVCFLLCNFPVLSAKIAEAGTRGDRSYCTRCMNCCTSIGAFTVSIFTNEGYN